MNPSVLFVFILSILLGVLRAADLAFGTDAVTGLCVVGSVWWRYLALGIVVLAAVLVGRTQPSRSEAVRSRRPLAGILAFVGAGGVFLAAAGAQSRWVQLPVVGGFVRCILECLCSAWLSTMGRCWLAEVEKALWRAVSGRGGQSAVLLERAAALYGEQLQLAPRDPYSGGVAGACGAGVFGSAGPGAACPAAGQWQNTVRSRACRICTLPVLAAALRTGFDERPELGRTGCLAGDLCRTGPLLRGRHWRSVRYSLFKQGADKNIWHSVSAIAEKQGMKGIKIVQKQKMQ